MSSVRRRCKLAAAALIFFQIPSLAPAQALSDRTSGQALAEVVRDVSIVRERVTFTAPRVILLRREADVEAIIDNAAIYATEAAEQGGGSILAERITISDPRALPVLLDVSLCPKDAAGEPVHLSVEGIDIIASDRLLPEGSHPERLRIDRMDLQFSVMDNCVFLRKTEFSGIRHSTKNGAFVRVNHISHEVRNAFQDEVSTEFRMSGLTFGDQDRSPLLTASEVFIGLRADPEMTTALFDLKTGPEALAEMAMHRSIYFDIQVSGFLLPLSHLLPSPERIRIGVGDDRQIAGDARISISVDNGEFWSEIDMNLSGLAEFSFASLFSIPATSESIFSDPRLAKASLSLRDDGVSDMIMALSGSTAVDLAHQKLGRLPEALKDPILEWLPGAMAKGGQVQIRPERPVSFLEIGMMSMINPQGLVDMLGIHTR